MRILFIVLNITGQGTFLRASGLAHGLVNSGHSVTILSSAPKLFSKTRIKNQDGIEIIEVSDFAPGPIRSGWDLTNLIRRKHILENQRFDIVHAFETRPTVIYPALKMQRKGMPLFFDWADWFGEKGSVEERPNPIMRVLLRPIETYYENNFRKKADGTSVICQSLFERAINFGISKENICLIPNGFNVNNWKTIEIEKAKENCGLNNNFLIGYLGSLFKRDAILMANTFNQIQTKLPNIKLLHIGHSNYHIQRYVNNPDSIIQTGPVGFQEMQTYLSACDILWLPLINSTANNGRFPLKFTNYISCGRPIITTNVGDIPQYVEKYKIGEVTEDNPDSLTEAVLTMFNNPSIRKIYGNNALNLSDNPDHSWDKRSKILESFYKSNMSEIKWIN